MCDLGATLGLRQGELFGVSLDDLDQRAYRVRVQVKREDGQLCSPCPSTGGNVPRPSRPACAS
jgi:hypothetical protein